MSAFRKLVLMSAVALFASPLLHANPCWWYCNDEDCNGTPVSNCDEEVCAASGYTCTGCACVKNDTQTACECDES